LSSSR